MLLPPICLSFGLPVCQSNFNGWFKSQGKYRATLKFNSSGCVGSNNLIYDSVCQSESKLSQNHLTHVLIQPSVIASNCFKATQVLRGPTQIVIWGSKIAKGPTR